MTSIAPALPGTDDEPLVDLGANLAGSSPPRDLIAVRIVPPARIGETSRELFTLSERLSARGLYRD